jgi:hypothetical protein
MLMAVLLPALAYRLPVKMIEGKGSLRRRQAAMLRGSADPATAVR